MNLEFKIASSNSAGRCGQTRQVNSLTDGLTYTVVTEQLTVNTLYYEV